MTFNSMLVEKSDMTSPRLNFKNSPKKDLMKGQKKSVASFIDVYAEQISSASDEKIHSNLNKYKNSMMKPLTKNSLVFRNKKEG